MEPFDLIGRVVVAAVSLWFGYGIFILTFVAKAFIPAECPWRYRIWAAVMFVLIAPWVLLRHGKVMRGFVMRNMDEPCPCAECVAERADG